MKQFLKIYLCIQETNLLEVLKTKFWAKFQGGPPGSWGSPGGEGQRPKNEPKTANQQNLENHL